ncbi:hypothetical protein AC480_03155 [miscellaneous Crenarchaeota group archaeon SMTZ1-55]|nr:MAG: hypothetical protein AC480_03155 [miscellaneous Crenarchaeota group archaeon SMTZ1-55]
MRRRNKILVSLMIAGGITIAIGVGVSYYVMSHYAFLGAVFDSNPLAVLEAAGRMAINRVVPTPTKSFNISDANKAYNQTVAFPASILELETAEQIIEWSVIHHRQPWVGNITAFLEASHVPVGDVSLHIVFIHTQGHEVPVMTVTYIAWNETQIVEKGWSSRIPYNAYTVVVTEALALTLLKSLGDSEQVVKTIIQNYGGAVILIDEESLSTDLW